MWISVNGSRADIGTGQTDDPFSTRVQEAGQLDLGVLVTARTDDLPRLLEKQAGSEDFGATRLPGTAACYAHAVDILIVRDPREPSKKCSLTPLRGMRGVQFVSLRGGRRVDAGRRIWLHPEGELLSSADRGLDLLLIDCAWRKLPIFSKVVDGELLRRRLPALVSAYPRRSKVAVDPEDGLASVEALYAAVALLEGPCAELLAKYHWAADFLAANPQLPRG